MLARIVAALAFAVLGAGIAVSASALTAPANHQQMTRYHGPPALPLTAAVVAAGGGATHFDSLRLLGFLTGPEQAAEVKRLIGRYGKVRVEAFVVTFNHAIDDALVVATKAGVVLPPVPRYLQNGGNLSARLIAAGTMANGRFDVGYMLEHMVSRKIHVIIMQQLDADPAVGSARNADFHIILTGVMGDLKTQYGL